VDSGCLRLFGIGVLAVLLATLVAGSFASLI
jgi:hypothetical protein